MTGAIHKASRDLPPETLDEREDDREEQGDATEHDGSGVELDFQATPSSIEAGTEVIRRFWATLPSSPGVYRMIDAKGDVLMWARRAR